MTIRETILDVVQHREKDIFLIDANSGREITYGEFHRMAAAVAAELSRRGLRKGDRVAIMLSNSCELAILYFGCIYLGAVIVPVNPSFSLADVQFILENCRPKILIAAQSSVNTLRGRHENLLELITASSAAAGSSASHPQISISDLPHDDSFIPLAAASPEDLIAIMYTSGTSAKPKGFAHKIGSMFRNATAFAAAQNIDRDTRFYLTLSMSYMGGFYNLLLLPFLCGASVVIDRVFDARSSFNFWEKAKKHNVNALWLAPTVMSILLRMDRGRTGEFFCRASVRHAFVGFAPLPLKVKNDFEARYGLSLVENYGLSETLFVTARSHATESQGYVGEPLPGINVRVASGPDFESSAGIEGEIQVLTPDLMAGYLDHQGELLPLDSAQWFSTGDVGRIDAAGSLLITGRKKDLIIRGGVNISPAAIEESLVQVDGVEEVAVVSIPHELYGEDIVAVIKMRPGLEFEPLLDALISHARATLAQHQQPARYVTMDEFPRTANGKIQKARIRELVREKLQIASSASHSQSKEPLGVAS